METFPNIEMIKDREDRELRVAEAKRAVARLRAVTRDYAESVSERERIAADEEAQRAQREAQIRFSDAIEELRQRFLALGAMSDRQSAGRELERLLTDFFVLYDMEPRLSYSLDREQIDGSLSYDTDDYIVEVRWRQEPVSRADADVFATKVRRKGKNAVGLFISVEGFSQDALDQYAEATPFLALDGSDLYLTLDQRVRLDDLIKAKKRHANETGNCFMPASSIV